MGHNTIVGHGRFVKPLFKKPSAADWVKAVRKSKSKGASAPAHKVPGIPKPPVVLKPPAQPVRPAPQFATAAERTIDKQIADFRDYLGHQHQYWADDGLALTHAMLIADKKYTAVMSRPPPVDLTLSIVMAVTNTLVFAAIPALGPVKEIAGRIIRNSEEAQKKLAEISTECLKVTREEFKKRSENEESLKNAREPAEIGAAYFEYFLKKTSAFETSMTIAVADIAESLDGTDATRLTTALATAKQAWTGSGFERAHRRPGGGINIEQTALTLLYEMLREFCKSRVSLWAEKETGIAPGEFTTSTRAPQKITSGEAAGSIDAVSFEGINSNQRAAMYKEFERMEWGDPSHPPIRNDGDLMSKWDFSMAD